MLSVPASLVGKLNLFCLYIRYLYRKRGGSVLGCGANLIRPAREGKGSAIPIPVRYCVHAQYHFCCTVVFINGIDVGLEIRGFIKNIR
jgi:hypothetical protein